MHLKRSLLAWALLLSVLPSAPAAVQDWHDIQGNVFKAEPAEALGPFALFRTPTGAGRRLPWRALPTEECARFGEQLGAKPDPAARWADATGELTGRLRGYLHSFEQVNLVTADLEARPEPDILIVFFVENSASGSWDMINQAVPLYHALVERHGGHVAAIQYGVNHGPQEHSDMGLRANVPWMLVNYAEQQRITTLFRQSPRRSDFGIYALSRDGVPVFGANNPDAAAVTQFFADANALLGLLRPTNPQSWPDRAHYLAAQYARQHQTDQAGPLLVGNPLVAARLKKAGIHRVDATIEVGADGKVTQVTLNNDGSIPEATVPHLTGPLQRSAVFVPAVNQGKFVPGTYHYLLEIPRD